METCALGRGLGGGAGGCLIKLQQRPKWNHPKHNATKGFSAKRLQSQFRTVSLNILPTVFRLVPSNLLEAFFFICFFLSGLQNRRRLLSTYNWVSVCIYRQIPPFQICETQRRASWTKLVRVNSHMNHFCQARSSCWCGSLAEVCPHTRFHRPPPRPAASRKRIRTYILLHNFIKGHSLQGY